MFLLTKTLSLEIKFCRNRSFLLGRQLAAVGETRFFACLDFTGKYMLIFEE